MTFDINTLLIGVLTAASGMIGWALRELKVEIRTALDVALKAVEVGDIKAEKVGQELGLALSRKMDERDCEARCESCLQTRVLRAERVDERIQYLEIKMMCHYHDADGGVVVRVNHPKGGVR